MEEEVKKINHTRIQMKELGLNEKQFNRYSSLINGEEIYPKSLEEQMKKVCNESGLCGDVMSGIIADWVKTQK